MQHKELQAILRKVAFDKNITIVQISSRSGLNKSTIWRVMNKSQAIDLFSFIKIALVLEINLDEFFSKLVPEISSELKSLVKD